MNKTGALLLGAMVGIIVGSAIAVVGFFAWAFSSVGSAIETSASSEDELTVSQCQSILDEGALTGLGFDPNDGNVNKEGSSCRWDGDGQFVNVTVSDSSYYEDVSVGDRSEALVRFTESCTTARYGLPIQMNPDWLELPADSAGCVSANRNEDYGTGMLVLVFDDSDLGRTIQVDINEYADDSGSADPATWQESAAAIATKAREAL